MSLDDSQKCEYDRLLQAFQAAQERGDFEQAESIGVQCLVFAAEEAERNSDESLRLVQEAHEHEDAARWEQTRHLEKQIEQDAECQTDHEPRFRP
jgi:hypothetical protein